MASLAHAARGPSTVPAVAARRTAAATDPVPVPAFHGVNIHFTQGQAGEVAMLAKGFQGTRMVSHELDLFVLSMSLGVGMHWIHTKQAPVLASSIILRPPPPHERRTSVGAASRSSVGCTTSRRTTRCWLSLKPAATFTRTGSWTTVRIEVHEARGTGCWLSPGSMLAWLSLAEPVHAVAFSCVSCRVAVTQVTRCTTTACRRPRQTPSKPSSRSSCTRYSTSKATVSSGKCGTCVAPKSERPAPRISQHAFLPNDSPPRLLWLPTGAERELLAP